MVNDKIQELKQESDAAYARQAQQHAASIQQREDIIAELQRELNSIELNSLSPEVRDIPGGDRTVAEVSPPPTPELPESACGLGLVS